MVNKETWEGLQKDFAVKGVTLVAVSKTKPAEDIMDLYQLGQREFGENYVQELIEKQAVLPKDIQWHFIGHLQSNKVKYIAPFIYLVQGVDNYKLLTEINKQAQKNNRVIDILLQMYIADEDTKFGFDEQEIIEILNTGATGTLQHIRIRGMMGMATNTDDAGQVKRELTKLYTFFKFIAATYFPENPEFNTCSMGMSADYITAIEAGSNMVRIGSLLFGKRGKPV